METSGNDTLNFTTDSRGHLENFEDWDRSFAEELAPQIGIPIKLTKDHWQVVDFLRSEFVKTGICPTVYQTCKRNGLKMSDLQALFPAGYQRGACKLAGISFASSRFPAKAEEIGEKLEEEIDKTPFFTVDAFGFLVDPEDWNEDFAKYKATEIGIGAALTDKHWTIINFLRDRYADGMTIPTIYETCHANKLELEELEQLFPNGYHRGAVKIAGLRLQL